MDIKIKCAQCFPKITFISYAQSHKIEKPNNWSLFLLLPNTDHRQYVEDMSEVAHNNWKRFTIYVS